MQTKSSYRALKWTLFMGIAATLASACVVSTGDGDDDDFEIEGGDGGTNNTSGTANTGGNKAGSSGSGGTAAGTTSAGTGGSMAAGGAGGTAADPDYPGVCDDSLQMPSMIDETATCTVKADDNACGACLKMNCCETLAACYGQEPTSACGYGPSPADDLGQFDCIVDCYKMNSGQIADGLKSQEDVIRDCAGECSKQCEDVGDGLINLDTQALLDCAQNGDEEQNTEDCNDVCFPPPM